MDSGFQILISLPLVLAKKDNGVAERPNKTLVRDALLRRPPHSVALMRNGCFSGFRSLSRHFPVCPGWVGFCRSLPFGLIRCTEKLCCGAIGGNRPRLCKKSGVMSPVGKILTKPSLFEAQSHSSPRFTAKRKGKLKSFPTASLRTDFSHSLGQTRTFRVRIFDSLPD